MKRINVLVAVHDPGGTKALVPLIEEMLQMPQLNCRVLAGKFSESWLRQRNLSFIEMPTDLCAEEAEGLFKLYAPDILVTGTSWASNSEQMLRNQARKGRMPSLVVIDYWKSFPERFLGCETAIADIEDFICVADEAMKHAMLKEGFNPARLIVTGHPHLDFLISNSTHLKAAGERALGELSAIFVSEDYPPGYLESVGVHPIRLFFEAFGKLAELAGNHSFEFHLKLHPKEQMDPFLLKTLGELAKLHQGPITLIPQEATLLNLLPSYQYAFGYQSMALFEAQALGLKTVALPLLKGQASPSLLGAMSNYGIRIAPNQDEVLRCVTADFPALNPKNRSRQSAVQAFLKVLRGVLGDKIEG